VNIHLRKYLDSVKKKVPEISEKELSYFSNLLDVKTLKKNDYYIEVGQVQKYIGFLSEGFFRSYYLDEKGNEKTVRFIDEYGFITHYSSFLDQKESKYNFKCLENSTVVNISYSAIQEVYKEIASFQKYGRIVAEEILKMQQKRIESFLFQSAEQRYLNFVEEYPQIYNKVSLTHLCSYIGIERQSLSRIRKRIIAG
jgi:CRP/FNR family transcriptional regulator